MVPTFSLWSRPSRVESRSADADRGTVLVVEDELMIGHAAAEALEEAGFTALTAASAEEAEVLLSQEKVDVLFTDIDLGGRDGFDLAARALHMRPGLAVVFASGRSRRCHAGRLPAGAAFLAKPYRLPELVGEVTRAVEARAYQS